MKPEPVTVRVSGLAIAGRDPVGQDRAQSGHGIVGDGLDFEGPDVDGPVDDPREAGAALVGGQGLAFGIDGQGCAAGVDGRAAGQEGDGLGRAAVVGQRAEPRVGDADLVAVAAVRQAAVAAAGADQVVRAGRGDRAAAVEEEVVGRRAWAGPVGVERDDRVVQGGRALVILIPPPKP